MNFPKPLLSSFKESVAFEKCSVVSLQPSLNPLVSAERERQHKIFLQVSNIPFYSSIRDVQDISETADLFDNGIVFFAEEMSGGSQLKLTLTFADGTQALFKPMR